jgi:hypothetical protein
MINPLGLLKGKHIDEFSRELARQLANRFPIESAHALSDKKRDKKLGRALNHVYKQARDYCNDGRLGIYGTARLGNGFKWELKEMGYQEDFIEEATKGLILNVRKK